MAGAALQTPEAPPGGQRMVLSGMSWENYESLGAVLRDRSGVRLTFACGTLELMTLSTEHEKLRHRLGRLVEILAEEAGLPLEPGGSMTFKDHDAGQGLEPDECYWIQHEAVVRGKLQWSPGDDPPPDLVIEVEVSRSAIDRLALHADLGVREVWCYDRKAIRILVLQPDGSYHQRSRSPTFPTVDPDDLTRFLEPDDTTDYLSVLRQFRAWLRQQRA